MRQILSTPGRLWEFGSEMEIGYQRVVVKEEARGRRQHGLSTPAASTAQPEDVLRSYTPPFLRLAPIPALSALRLGNDTVYIKPGMYGCTRTPCHNTPGICQRKDRRGEKNEHPLCVSRLG